MSVRQKSPKQRANQEFNEEIKAILDNYANLSRLQEYYFRHIKAGHYMQFKQTYEKPEGGKVEVSYDVTKKDIRGLYLQLRNRIAGLKNLFRKKKCRSVLDLNLILDPNTRPENWPLLLKGQNRVSVATGNLVDYLKTEDFGTVNPPQYDSNGNQISPPSGVTLASQLPVLTSGYGLKAAFALLFFHAIRVADVIGNGGGHLDDSDHRKNYFTPAMLSAFGTGVTPYRYTRYGPNGQVDVNEEDGVKIPNNSPQGYQIGEKVYEQVRESTIDYLANGKYKDKYSTIRSGGRDTRSGLRLTREYAHLTTVQTILNLNIKDSDNDLSTAENIYWDNPKHIEDAIREYLDARDVRTAWADALKPVSDIRRKMMRNSPRKTPMGARGMTPSGGRRAATGGASPRGASPRDKRPL